MRIRSIAIAALMSSLLCSCGSSGQPEYQASQKESSVPAKDPTEQIKEVSTSQLKDWMSAGQPFTLIDVKSGQLCRTRSPVSCSIAWVACGRRRPRQPSRKWDTQTYFP
jgi:hypothetical protein